ncbi:Beta-ketoacyl synthase, N-terminal domain [Arboricoccus pini]|uniref:Beta-ketoacyl synthase, N-terminal domain n=1 Tax=Arboricoccus pini TaxID=1963835 RepID=A0A212R4N5_9PROT|nr:beta-ketoacyl synthase chain length factor [Arboricoccus pini]SNB66795.1 Beta-ketoacyl synthase, N-terminal domain [Arboricoccus pini]
MSASLVCHIAGLTVLGPGFASPEAGERLLRGEEAHVMADYAPPVPASLSPNERRRAGMTVKLAVAAAEQALAAAGQAADLPSVFGTSNGDGAIVNAMLQTVAGPNPMLSPTQFHNSVHNAAAAYWSIGNACRANSTSIGAYDDTFASTLLRAALQVEAEHTPVLCCAYDAPLPFPLSAVRATLIPMATAAVLTPAATLASRARLKISFVPEPGTASSLPDGHTLAPLVAANPAGRALPLFAAIARRQAVTLCLPCQDDAHLLIEVTPT